jgi:hypothetical protein
VFFDGQPGATNTSALEQNVTLTAGQSYTLSFWQAAAQFTVGVANHLDTTEQWQVSVGSDLLVSTPLMTTAYQGDTAWEKETYTFKSVSGGSELLSFLAVGGPNGDPPTVLLDGVSLTAPDPESAALLGVGLLGILAYRRHQNGRT